MQVKKLARGANQPFYSVIGTDGGKRCMFYSIVLKMGRSCLTMSIDVAEDNMEPISLTRDVAHNLFTKRATFSRYFTNAELGRSDGFKGRLIMSEELQKRYPEDEEATRVWCTSCMT